jgi:nucleoside-diphosphate-sugar epimerase
MRILVTGGTGFIGGHLLRSLAARHEVVALARTPPSADDGVEWVRQDLGDPLDVGLLPDRLDAVIHLAQSRRYREFPDGARDLFAINLASTASLLEYARGAGARSFVFASTGGLYGHSYERLVETDPVSPLNFYFASKYAAELLLGSYRPFFTTVVLRFFFVYGPGQERMLVPSLLERVRRGEEVPVEGNPGLRINPIHVADAVRVFEPALALERSDVFNVAGDEVVRIEELAELLGRATGADVRVRHVEAGRKGDLVGDNRRMKEVLGVDPRIRLGEGLAELVAVTPAAPGA